MIHKIHPWAYINAILVAFLLLGVVFFISQSKQFDALDSNYTNKKPDFFVEGADMITFNEQGYVINHFHNDELTYYGNTKILRIKRPHATYYNDQITQPK